MQNRQMNREMAGRLGGSGGAGPCREGTRVATHDTTGDGLKTPGVIGARITKAERHIEETPAPFSLLRPGIDESFARIQAAAQCGVATDLVEDVFPCTPLQEEMLALTAKQTGKYISQTLLELRIDVEAERLERTWRETIATIPILRTRVVNLAGQGLVQVVVAGQGSFTASQDLEAYLKTDKQEAMGLGTPFTRFAIINRCGSQRPVVVWTVHHALFDEWSMPLVLKQVEQAYHGCTRDRLVPFQGFVKHILQSRDGATEYWQSQLGGSEAVPFPSLPSPGYQPQADDGLSHWISGLRWPQSDITTSSAIRVAWAILLARYTNSSDVIFGATLTGRHASVSGVERMAGPTIATVPVRINFSREMEIHDLIQQVQTQAIDMMRFEQTGLLQIRRIGPDIDRGSQFQTLVVLQPAARDKNTESKKLFEARRDAEGNSAKGLEAVNTYAILVECQLTADGMRLLISFDTQVVERVQVQRLAQQFEHVLRQVCAENTAPLMVKDVGTVSEQDLREIGMWNETVPTRAGRCVHDLIVERCREQPDAPAVNAWDGDLTYSELDELSSRLARHLGTFNLPPGTIIPLCFEKTKWAIVAVLGVLRAGAAYAMVDMGSPTARIKSVCEDLEADLMLCSIPCVSQASQLVGRAIAVEPVVKNKAMYTNSKPKEPSVKLTDPIYAAFTSGSTGKPKGVVIEHGGFFQRAMANGPILSLSSESRVLQFASFVFDVANRDILYTLLFGGCICIPSESQRSNNLIAFMNEQRVNWVSITPSATRLLNPDELPTLRYMVLCGEPMDPGLVDTWADRLNLINAYGPSEATTISSITKVTRMTNPAEIGKGSGSILWVVDPADHDRLAPIGAVGELLIESPSIGSGYLNRPAEMALPFLPITAWYSRFRSGPKCCRLYKTGDLVQYAVDGSLRFMGRKDTQVKLRGQRIELSEVEHHTRQCFPGARDVVSEVVKPTEAGRAPMLVAFVWMDKQSQKEKNYDDEKDESNEHNKANDILAAPSNDFCTAIPVAETTLKDAVPAYMVPAVFLLLRDVPLSATGKTDRRRLRDRAAALSRADIEAYQGTAAAQRNSTTPAELALQQLWARVFKLPPAEIAADDSFFRLGGDSIAAMKLVGMAREDGLTLTVAHIFQQPKLSDLAHFIQPASDVAVQIPSPFSLLDKDGLRNAILQLAMDQCQVSSDQIADIYPCTALQEGLIALTAKASEAYIAHFSYRLPNDIDLDRFHVAWNAVACANPILRTRIIQHDQWGSFQVVVSADLPWAVYDIGEGFGAEATATFGLDRPLVYAAVIRGDGPNIPPRFILSIHHAAYDAWSLPLLLEQAVAALQGNSLLARPFSPFVAYSIDSNLAAEAFWRAQFIDLEATCFPSLPTPAYTPNPTESITYSMALSHGLTDDFTPSTKLRLAWALTLAQYSDVPDVVFGLTVTGRAAPVAGIEQMTGPTIATIPLRVRLDPKATLSQTLQRVQDQSTAMLAYEQTGLQNIRRLSTKTAMACQFQNLLVIQPQRDEGASGLFSEADVSAGKGAFTTYALTLECDLKRDTVTVQATYDPQTMGAMEVQRMLYQLGHIMQQINVQSETLIRDVCGLCPEDRRQLQEWNRAVPARVDRCLHDLVVDRCRAQPDAPAVCAWDGDFTYGELNALSSALAAHLAERGVVPEVFVPLCFEKSRWTTVAMLGVIKAGGAFVLLDPSHPRARLRGICQIVSASLVVSSAANQALAADLAAAMVVVSDHETTWRSSTQPWSGSAVIPDNALYAVFTSGSTGTPKGAVIEHASFCTATLSQTQRKQMDSSLRLFQFSSYSFDTSISDTFTTLLSGGCICVPSESGRKDNLTKEIRKLQANCMELTPSVAKLLQPRDVPTIHTLILGGEEMERSNLDLWSPSVRLMNSYGPAECCVESIVQTNLNVHSNIKDIGYAAGCVCWVVSRADHERLVPIGAVGELLIEGPIVGRGYLNNPKQTTAAFVETPPWLRQFRGGSNGSGRLYKTGDLVQYAVDGSLRFMGRKDTQVKLRGQRIELGEVEHHTRRSFPGARDVVSEVVTPTEAGREPILVAFIYMDKESEEDNNGEDDRHGSKEINESNQNDKVDDILAASTNGFRAAIFAAETQLLDTVPGYMVPAVFLPLRGVPLSATGKTDRRRLRDRAAALSRADIEAYNAPPADNHRPVTPAEHTLQQLWARVLNLAPADIGVNDNFFRLGGDSITAMKLAGVARKDGLDIPVTDIFQHPTICQQASATFLEYIRRSP
ncbi:unnamed protein product [Penicillium manginii]